jgi:hypothetical protein
VYFEDDGKLPEVPPFHAMNIVPGECLEPILEAPPADVLLLVPDRAFGAARMLAALHSSMGFRNTKSRKSSSLIWPCSTSSYASAVTSRMSGTPQ